MDFVAWSCSETSFAVIRKYSRRNFIFLARFLMNKCLCCMTRNVRSFPCVCCLKCVSDMNSFLREQLCMCVVRVERASKKLRASWNFFLFRFMSFGAKFIPCPWLGKRTADQLFVSDETTSIHWRTAPCKLVLANCFTCVWFALREMHLIFSVQQVPANLLSFKFHASAAWPSAPMRVNWLSRSNRWSWKKSRVNYA